ncbi:hypothetical protein [Veillonella atypica]|jgi:hypothetical protein|uniref:hypothetical protein n=1 Tax=Veillonella atypica TaxID=39777 RepID=UPI00352E3DFE
MLKTSYKYWKYFACILFSIFVVYLHNEINIDIVNAVLTISSILLGLIITSLSIFIGITQERVMVRIRKRNKGPELLSYFEKAIRNNFLVIICSLGVLFKPDVIFSIFEYQFSIIDIVTFVFLSFTILSLISTYKLINLILLIFRHILIDT